MLIYSLKSVFAVLYGKKSTNNKLFTRILSIMLTTVFLIVTMTTSAVMFFASTFISILITHFSTDYSPVLLSLINLILIIFDTVLIYLILPPDRIKLSQAIPGAVAAILCIALSSYGFSYYVRYIADYSRIYGALGSVIVLLLWLYICSVIILSGGVINAKFTKEKDAP